jgi:hypothetical protein
VLRCCYFAVVAEKKKKKKEQRMTKVATYTRETNQKKGFVEYGDPPSLLIGGFARRRRAD